MEIIDLKTAKAMVANYQATRKKLIDSTYGINDTESTWIPVADLKAYVNNLPADATGIRIYLSAYDNTDASYPSQTTVVIIGTVNDETGNATDAIVGDSTLANRPALAPNNKDKNCPPICT